MQQNTHNFQNECIIDGDDDKLTASASTSSSSTPDINPLSQKIQRRASKTFISAALILAQNLTFPNLDLLSNLTSKHKVDTNKSIDLHGNRRDDVSLASKTISLEKQIIIDFSEYFDEEVKSEPG